MSIIHDERLARTLYPYEYLQNIESANFEIQKVNTDASLLAGMLLTTERIFSRKCNICAESMIQT